MSERTPDLCSMTADLTPETERENLAEKVFLLERWQANAFKVFSKLEGERDAARADLQLARAENARMGKCTNCEELRGSLEAANAALSFQTDEHRKARTGEQAAQAELSRLRARADEAESTVLALTQKLNETTYQLKICREDRASADRTVRVTKAALDAAIEAV